MAARGSTPWSAASPNGCELLTTARPKGPKEVDQFRIEVADIELAGLRERLARTRTPDSVPGAGWRLGTDPVFLGGLLTYWQKTFNWRAQEARLNGFPQYNTVVDGVPIHFVRCPGRGA